MTIPASLATAFLAYLALVAALIAAVLIRFLPARAAGIGIAVLVGWLVYAGILGYSGVVAAQPLGIPGILVLLAPIFVFIAVVLVISPVGREVPNVAMGMFPFSFIPGFMAPLAVMLHVLAFRVVSISRPIDR